MSRLTMNLQETVQETGKAPRRTLRVADLVLVWPPRACHLNRVRLLYPVWTFQDP